MIDFAALRSEHDLRAVMEQKGVTLNRNGQGPCPKCGGRDRFYLNKNRGKFGCRSCNPKGGDVVDFVMWLDGIDRRAAIRALQGLPCVPCEILDTQPWKDDPAWQPAARHRIAVAQARLNCAPSRQFLKSRGLSMALCASYGLGFDPQSFHPLARLVSPAVLLPYRFADGTITGIRERYVEPALSVLSKCILTKDSRATLFGSDLLTGAPVLVLTEGEFNCIALRQVLPDRFDVASFGGDTQTRYIPAAVAKYARTVLWMDDPQKLEHELARCTAHDVRGIVSPTGPDGKKIDANDQLRIEPDRLRRMIVDAGGNP